jgi:hypothetical protein
MSSFAKLAAIRAALPAGTPAAASTPAAAPAPAAPVAAAAPAVAPVDSTFLLPPGWRVQKKAETREPYWPAWRAPTVEINLYDENNNYVAGTMPVTEGAFAAALSPRARDEAAWNLWLHGGRALPLGAPPPYLRISAQLAVRPEWRALLTRLCPALGAHAAIVGAEEAAWREELRLTSLYRKAGENFSRFFADLGSEAALFLSHPAFSIGRKVGLERDVTLTPKTPLFPSMTMTFAAFYGNGEGIIDALSCPEWEAVEAAALAAYQAKLDTEFGDEQEIIGWRQAVRGNLSMKDFDTRSDWRDYSETSAPEPIYGRKAAQEFLRTRSRATNEAQAAFILGIAEGMAARA